MLPATPSDEPWGYRHKVHFVFDVTTRGAAMGHYRLGTRHVLPVRECPVHDERGNRLAFAFRDALAGTRAPELRGLAIRVGANTPEIMATLIVSGEPSRSVRAATRRVLEGSHAPTSVHLNLHPKRNAFIFGRETRQVAGAARMREEVAGTAFLISPTAFFQTNIAAAALLVTLVLDACGRTRDSTAVRPVLDLYAGAGLFALPLAKAGHRVTAIEENREAVADGEASQRLNRIPPERCRFIARPVEQALNAVIRRSRDPVDIVVLDPPREGCSELALQQVFGDLRPRTAVYVSCSPEALARDLASIVPHGYRIESLQPVDMFPHTDHVETVVVLGR
jgi:23S rRNA (uracil1939-C5)-methyltransferase